MSAVAGEERGVLVYTSPFCGYCAAAKRLLQAKGVAVTEIDVLAQPAKREEMLERSRRRTVPQIFIGTKHVGGFEELRALEVSGELDGMLRNRDDSR